VRPIGVVRSSRRAPLDDDWGDVAATSPWSRRSTPGRSWVGEFSYIEVIFVFHGVDPAGCTRLTPTAGESGVARVGIFAQRAKDRPNRLGLCTCELVAVRGDTLEVRALDAIDGTPVLDIKPYMTEFAPRQTVRQPTWSHELMAGYF